MTEDQCVHVVIQDPSLVVPASHESLGLLHLADSETLIVDAFECTIDYSILHTLGIENPLVQINVLHAYPFTIDYHITRNSLCCIVYYVLLIYQTIHLGSESHELSDTIFIVLTLEDRSQQLLVEVEEG